MNIRFTRRGPRTRLICSREDGSIEACDLGPSLPQHDLAHFVVEKRLGLTRGFYGNVARGYTMQELAELRSLVRAYEALGDGESMRLALHHVD